MPGDRALRTRPARLLTHSDRAMFTAAFSARSRGNPAMAIIHRIGTPENDSEARAIKRFGKHLPDDCFVFHNFEVTTGRGLPYEYDIAVLTPHALYHVEVKGYHGEIRGNPLQWVFENGGVYPSPIPLANKKTKV